MKIKGMPHNEPLFMLAHGRDAYTMGFQQKIGPQSRNSVWQSPHEEKHPWFKAGAEKLWHAFPDTFIERGPDP